jgi:hypothetical protein
VIDAPVDPLPYLLIGKKSTATARMLQWPQEPIP